MNEHVISWLWNRYWTEDDFTVDGSVHKATLDRIEAEAAEQLELYPYVKTDHWSLDNRQ